MRAENSLPAASATATDARAPSPDNLSTLIERWFFERFHNSPVSRDVELFNHVRAAVDELKAILQREA
jgi:succinylarginine dihydrolase